MSASTVRVDCEASRSASSTPASSAIGSHAHVCGSRAMCCGSNVHTRSPVSRPLTGRSPPRHWPRCCQHDRTLRPARRYRKAGGLARPGCYDGEQHVLPGPCPGRGRRRATAPGTVPGQADHEWRGQGSGGPAVAGQHRRQVAAVHNAREASSSRAATSGTAHATAVSLPPDRPGVLTVARVRGPDVAR